MNVVTVPCDSWSMLGFQNKEKDCGFLAKPWPPFLNCLAGKGVGGKARSGTTRTKQVETAMKVTNYIILEFVFGRHLSAAISDRHARVNEHEVPDHFEHGGLGGLPSSSYREAA